MTTDETRKFKEQQLAAGIAGLEQEAIKFERNLRSVRVMLADLKAELAELAIPTP